MTPPPHIRHLLIRHPELVYESEPMLAGSAEAVFSPARVHRYWLSRHWGMEDKRALWVMLNPSTADAFTVDPTIRRCIAFTKAWGLDGLEVVNLFALRATDPRQLARHPDPVGPLNDEVITVSVPFAAAVVAAWGAHRLADCRSMDVAEILGAGAQCLGTTRAGYPRHPLYVRSDTPREVFRD